MTDIKNETYVQESEVKEILIHPQYRPADTYDYDIALLLLDKPIEYNPFVRPICLPPTGKKRIFFILVNIFSFDCIICDNNAPYPYLYHLRTEKHA